MVHYTLKKAIDIKPGDKLVNLGTVDKVETFDTGGTGKFTNITITSGFCKSCAFYWFKANEQLAVQNFQPEPSQPTPSL